MIAVPAVSSFPTGTGDTAGGGSVTSAYYMASTEVTYEQWYAVRTWAVANSYTFANQGCEGSSGTVGAATTTAKLQPVTTVSWLDAIVWCNALTEYCRQRRDEL